MLTEGRRTKVMAIVSMAERPGEFKMTRTNWKYSI
jgi:hypothetical protein